MKRLETMTILKNNPYFPSLVLLSSFYLPTKIQLECLTDCTDYLYIFDELLFIIIIYRILQGISFNLSILVRLCMR
ncbi:hypothetical protein F4703DRAFT_1862063 [Phycomyces blakesleeanus]